VDRSKRDSGGPCVSGLPALDEPRDMVVARYITTDADFRNGAAERIVEGLGHGTEQIARSGGLEVLAASDLLPGQRKPCDLLGHGEAGDGWVYFDVGLPREVCDLGRLGFAGLLSFVAGDVFGKAYAHEALILTDIALPEHPGPGRMGPQWGVDGVYEKVGRRSTGGPLLGLLLKPDLGVPPSYYAEVARAAAEGGIDYIKEDELTLDHAGCPRAERVEAVSRALEPHRGRILYAANVTGRQSSIAEHARSAVARGATAVLVNGVLAGLDTVNSLAMDDDVAVPIHLHRAGFDLLASGMRAIGVPCLTSLFRLAGADVIHVGPVLGDLFSEDTVEENIARLTRDAGIPAALPVFSRSCEESIPALASRFGSLPCLLLFDAAVYRSAAGVEGSVRRLRAVADRCFPE